MLKAKHLSRNRSELVRKPSLPNRPSSNVSNQSILSCASERGIGRKSMPLLEANLKNNNQEMTQRSVSRTRKNSQKNLKKPAQKIYRQVPVAPQHSLSIFQWLIILRHCFHIENKRRLVNNVRQKVLINYVRNKIYQDSLWNRIMVVENENKFSSLEIIQLLEKQGKPKMSIDDIFACLSKRLISLPCEEAMDAETARFSQQAKINSHLNSNLNCQLKTNMIPQMPIPLPKKVKPKNKGQKVTQFQNKPNSDPIKQKQESSNQVDESLGTSMCPVSVGSQSINISFSMEDSESQIRNQSYQSFEGQQGNFENAFNGLETLKQRLSDMIQTNQEKEIIAELMKQILGYSVYETKKYAQENKKDKDEKRKGLGEPSYFYGLKLVNKNRLDKISIEALQIIFSSRQMIEYFYNLQAVKVKEYFSKIGPIIPILSKKLQILNLSSNNIKKLSFMKTIDLSNLQFVNLNNNKISNFCDLLKLGNIGEIHIKNNCVQYVIAEKVNSKKLRMVDLGNNLIKKQEDLCSLSNLSSLCMLNLEGNPLLQHFKPKGILKRDLVVNHSEMYVFSNYIHYKDIAFEPRERQGKQNSNSQNQCQL